MTFVPIAPKIRIEDQAYQDARNLILGSAAYDAADERFEDLIDDVAAHLRGLIEYTDEDREVTPWD